MRTAKNATYITTDAAPATVSIHTLADGEVTTVSANVVAIKSDKTAGAGYQLHGTFRNNSGTVSQVGTTTAGHSVEDAAGWDASLSINGITVELQLTGAAATTINWAIRVETYSYPTS